MKRVGVVVLAAGASSRMGRPKQLLVLGGETLVRRAAREAIAFCGTPVVVVVGAHAPEVTLALDGVGVSIVENALWSRGMGGSLAVGIGELERLGATAAIVTLCDLPHVGADVFRRLARPYLDENRSLVASRYGGALGVPALFGSAHFAELRALEGATGARAVIARHIAMAVAIDCPEAESDVDTPEAYEKLLSARPDLEAGVSRPLDEPK